MNDVAGLEGALAARTSSVRIMILAAGSRGDPADERSQIFADAVRKSARNLKETLEEHFSHATSDGMWKDETEKPSPSSSRPEIMLVSDESKLVADEKGIVDLPARIESWFKGADVAVFYFIGHGEIDYKRSALLLTFPGFDQRDLLSNNISTEQIKNRIDGANPRLTYVILDCCSAAYGMADVAAMGARKSSEKPTGGSGDSPTFLDTRGVFGLFASGIDDKAMVDRATKSVIFTTEFCKLLSEGTRRLESWISLDTLFREMNERLARRNVAAPLRVATLDERSVFIAKNNRLSGAVGAPGALDELVSKFDRQRDRIDEVANYARTLSTRLDEKLPQIEPKIRTLEEDYKKHGTDIRFLKIVLIPLACLFFLLAVGFAYLGGLHTSIRGYLFNNPPPENSGSANDAATE